MSVNTSSIVLPPPTVNYVLPSSPSGRLNQSSVSVCASLPITVSNILEVDVLVYITGITSNGKHAFITVQNSVWQPIDASIDDALVRHIIHPHEPHTLEIPVCLTSGRLWLSESGMLSFGYASGRLVEPSFATHENVSFTYLEFSYTPSTLVANPTYVDAVSRLRVAFDIETATEGSSSYHYPGLKTGALEGICAGLLKQSMSDGWPWGSMCAKSTDSNASWLRAYSPNSYLAFVDERAFDGYFAETVANVWRRFRPNEPLVVNLDSTADIKCSADERTRLMHCSDIDITLTQPTARDIFSCVSGPFVTADNNTTRNSVATAFAAAFNRGTLLLPSGRHQPGVCDTDFYPTNTTSAFNWYSKLVHEWQEDGKGYAFPYDDVVGCNGSDSSASFNVAGASNMTIWVQ